MMGALRLQVFLSESRHFTVIRRRRVSPDLTQELPRELLPVERSFLCAQVRRHVPQLISPGRLL